jgi:uncharacterized protein YdcH (DUF465 family)
MNEDEARQKIKAAFNRLRAEHELDDEDVKEKGNSVEYHIDAIRQASDGNWQEPIAYAYVQNLETQIEEELEEASPHLRNAFADTSDDPTRELGISSREFRDELQKLSTDDGVENDLYDSEDMREYIEDADDTAGEDERYRYRE